MIERAEAVGDTFSYLSTSLKTIQGDLQNERDVAVTQVNSLLEQINNVNQQIQNVEPNGYLPNDLYDERDWLLDEISKFMPVSLEYTKSSGNASATSEGVVTVQLQTSQGPITLLDGKTHQINAISLTTNQDSYVTGIHIGDEIRNPESFPQGKLKGLIEASGYIDNSGNRTGVYASMIDDLDEMAYEFVNWFNDKHEQGVTLDGENGVSFLMRFLKKKELQLELLLLIKLNKTQTISLLLLRPLLKMMELAAKEMDKMLSCCLNFVKRCLLIPETELFH